MDTTSTIRQTAEAPKMYFEACYLDEYKELAFGEEPSTEDWPEPDEVHNILLDEENYVAFDSAEDDLIGIYPKDVAQPFDEEQKSRYFATFSAVQDAKPAIKRSRGFFSPFVPPHLAGAKGKARCGKNGKALFCRKGSGEGKEPESAGVMSADNTKDSSTYR